ncbi:MOSC domain-containing protein [Defluviimonas sp. WL0002]|uniref:MOSC domain-containing protein n=1 Tax=Albidovulum marisflavi TaxID=2984159 RepID=A0ABT2ZE40_9RHOB|nr:MOSC domain-containing protein [Defluviimonas sp. WL0002]MCV2869346.1 MOSC domain-containing protein [Defluviimonas sp. WL0002]
MTARLALVCRHPIKSIGYEEIKGATLTEGRALPFDREWAVAHEAAKFGRALTEWSPKLNFLRGVVGHKLMAIRTTSDTESRRVTLTHPDASPLSIAPDDAADAAALIDWLRPLWPSDRPSPAFVGRVPGQAMTDWPDPFISILSLSSLGELSARMGREISPHRFRGNLWIDGLPPFAEFDLIGKTLRIGGAELEVRQRITRCKATTVDPDTGISDADTLAALKTAWGHQDFGTYAVVTRSGAITLGDEVTIQ